MAITTLDGALAGMQTPVFFARSLSGTLVAGRPYTAFYVNAGAAGSNIPGAAVAPTPGISGAALTTYAGQLPFPTISSGNRYLARFVAQAPQGNGGQVMLCDRLWHNSGINVSITTSQTINSVTWPARDNNGAITGAGVMVGVEVTTALGVGTPSYTMNYTDCVNGAGRTSTNIVATAASAIQGTFTPMGLQAGDTGVQSIQQFTISATHTSGAISLVAYRVIASVELTTTGNGGALDAVSGGFPRMYDNTVPFLMMVPSSTTSQRIFGQLVYTDG